MNLNQVPPVYPPLQRPRPNDQPDDNQADDNRPDDTAAPEPRHECSACLESSNLAGGAFTCPVHFYCTSCIIEAVTSSLRFNTQFPASCCDLTEDGIPVSIFEHLLTGGTLARYCARLDEHTTPPQDRVYCTNPQCAAFLSALQPSLLPDGTPSPILHIIECHRCRTATCQTCKGRYERPSHTCILPNTDPTHRPDWLPAYSAAFRSKRCPKCTQWIQLTEACNHMKCTICAHEFCFVCLLPWEQPHDCPVYQDPVCGYDDEGYERDRGIHLYTGRDRQGLDRKGFNAKGEYGRPTVDPRGLEGEAMQSLAERFARGQIVELELRDRDGEGDGEGDALPSPAGPVNPAAVLAATLQMLRDAQARLVEAEAAVEADPGDCDVAAALANAVDEEAEAERAVQAAREQVQAQAEAEADEEEEQGGDEQEEEAEAEVDVVEEDEDMIVHQLSDDAAIVFNRT